MFPGIWRGHFIAFDLDGVTRLSGLGADAFTKELFQNGQSRAAAAVTVAEIGDGAYAVTAPLNEVGFWSVAVTVSSTGQTFVQDVEVVSQTGATSGGITWPRATIRTYRG